MGAAVAIRTGVEGVVLCRLARCGRVSAPLIAMTNALDGVRREAQVKL